MDYCLQTDKHKWVLIEVKRAGVDLGKHQKQLLQYAFSEGVKLAALTDGLVWWLYLSMAEGIWEQRRFSVIDFREGEPYEAASAMHRFLSRENVINGKVLRDAQGEFDRQKRDRGVRARLPEAWRQLLVDPPGPLLDSLEEAVKKISGHSPDRETVLEFLRERSSCGFTKDELPALSLQRDGRRDRPEESESSIESKRRSVPPEAFWLDGRRHEVRSWREMLVRVCELLAKEVGPSDFEERVADLRGSKRPYFSPSQDKLRAPKEIAGTNLYVEGNFSSPKIRQLTGKIMRAVRGSDSGFKVETASQRR